LGNLRSSGAFWPPLRPWRPRKLPSRLPMAMALPAGTSGSALQVPAPCWRHHGALKRPAALRCPPLPKRRRPQRRSACACRAPCDALVLPRARPGSPAALAWLCQCLPCHSLPPGGLAVPPRVLRPALARVPLRAGAASSARPLLRQRCFCSMERLTCFISTILMVASVCVLFFPAIMRPSGAPSGAPAPACQGGAWRRGAGGARPVLLSRCFSPRQSLVIFISAIAMAASMCVLFFPAIMVPCGAPQCSAAAA